MRKSSRRAAPFWLGTPLIDEREIFTELAAKKGSSLFLGRYSLNEVLAVLDKKGILKEARKRFLWPLAFEIDSSEYPLQRLQIYLREKKPDSLIVDIKIRESEFVPRPLPGAAPPPTPQKALSFEWLTLQNPLCKFDGQCTPLPGQTRPGLNLSPKIMDLFLYLGRVTRKDCLLAFPAYFHNAVLFSRYFHFWNPLKEGEVLAIRSLFSHMPLKQMAWIVHLNCLWRRDGTVYEWAAEEQVLPLTGPLKGVFDSRPYKEAVAAARETHAFSVDWAEFARRSRDLPPLCGGA